jgi:hypothetical protein
LLSKLFRQNKFLGFLSWVEKYIQDDSPELNIWLNHHPHPWRDVEDLQTSYSLRDLGRVTVHHRIHKLALGDDSAITTSHILEEE